MDKAGKCLHMKGTGNAKAQRQECQEPVGTSLGRNGGGVAGSFKRHAVETNCLLRGGGDRVKGFNQMAV